MSKQIICNICLTKGNIIPMQAMDGYFKCPECPNEAWPDRDGRFVEYWRNQQYLEQKYRSCSLPDGVKVHGGDSSGASNDRKEKMKKKTVSQLNAGLSGKFESR